MSNDTLTDAEYEYMYSVRDKYVELSTNNDKLDIDAAETAILNLYAANDLPNPRKVLFCKSMNAAHKFIAVYNSLKDEQKKWAMLENRELSSEWCTQIYKEKFGDRPVPIPTTYFGGNLNSYLAGFYEVILELCNPISADFAKRLRAYIEYVKTCGITFLYDEIAVVCERITEFKRNEEGLLHCENDYAVKYSDGTGICVWRGQRIDEDWIFDTANSLTPQVALQQDNSEYRRIACEILGWDSILKELGSVTIDKHENPIVGELVEVNFPEEGKARFLRVQCDTGRSFALPVPPDMQRATQAQAWMNHTTEDMCIPGVRT